MFIENPYIPKVDKFECSHEFSYLANYFDTHDESYTNTIKGTIEYIKFLKSQNKFNYL